MNHFRNHNSWSINGLHQIKNLCSLQVNRFENIIKPRTFENCNVTCAIWEEIFEDIDDALKDLKATDDIIKSDLTRLSIENVEQNKKLETIQDQSNLLSSQNSVLESSIKTIEARLDILESNSGKGSEIPKSGFEKLLLACKNKV